VVPLCPEKPPDASSLVKSIMSTVNNSELEVKPIELPSIDDVTTEVVDSRVDPSVVSRVVVCCKVVVKGCVYVTELPCQVFEPLKCMLMVAQMN